MRRELIESRDVLRQNLGLNEVIFAYPFGGRSNMTASVLQVVRRWDISGAPGFAWR